MRRPRRKSAQLAVGVGTVGLLVALLVGAEITDAVLGCGSVDPTDPANYTEAQILNDTPTVARQSEGTTRPLVARDQARPPTSAKR